MFNPYSQQIIKVNGINGANAYQLLPNSSALLLDETSPKLFLVQTDGAGYKNITAYQLIPCEEEKQPTINDILERISKLEELINAKYNTSNDKRKQSDE